MSDPANDPYIPPAPTTPGPSTPVPVSSFAPGRECENCGSTNTGADTALRSRPSVIAFVLFGWLFLLIRTAFKPKTETCRDCGSSVSFRTPGNNIAMALLIIIVVVTAISVLAEMNKTAL